MTDLNSKSKNFIIHLGVYPFDVMVSMGETDEELDIALKECHLEYNRSLKMAVGGKGTFYMNEANQSIIRTAAIPETPEEYGSLQHEIFHCATFVMNRIGAKLKLFTSDEPYAYLIQYITTEIYKNIGHAGPEQTV